MQEQCQMVSQCRFGCHHCRNAESVGSMKKECEEAATFTAVFCRYLLPVCQYCVTTLNPYIFNIEISFYRMCKETWVKVMADKAPTTKLSVNLHSSLKTLQTCLYSEFP
jgi:hypothetical protein